MSFFKTGSKDKPGVSALGEIAYTGGKGSIANRVFLILLTGIFAAGAATILLAENERRKAFAELADFRTADRVQQTVTTVERFPETQREQLLATGNSFGLNAHIVAEPDGSAKPDQALSDAIESHLGERRQIRIDQAVSRCENAGPGFDGGFGPPPELPFGGLRSPETGGESRNGAPSDISRRFHFAPPEPPKCQSIFVLMKDGKWLNIRVRAMRNGPGSRSAPLFHSIFSPYSALFILFLGLLVFFVARMTARPISDLAKAAVALGNDIDRKPLPESGPREIHVAASAFNAMQARIKRQIAHRTQMLAAITHDLQTPLTRMRLRLEKVSDDELKARLIDDLGVMHGMIKEGLELARSMDSVEPRKLVDLDSVVSSVCDNFADAGRDVVMSGSTGASIAAQPLALQRCLENLIDNALKYGQSAQVQLQRDDSADAYSIKIRDRGPGIPEHEFESVFEPFYRLEISRNRDTGGTGLGLSIAKNIAESHGGKITLANRPRGEGGLEVTLLLPMKK